MPCYHPVPAFQEGSGRPVRLWPPLGTANLSLPCGRCLGCRTARAAEWARRCMHEASSWRHNIFLTLTYDDAHLPPHGHLRPDDCTKFLKRLRIHAHRHGGFSNSSGSARIRYFLAGEYGENNDRPHYHLIVFNCWPEDARKVGKDLYESPLLAKLWGLGLHRFGAVTGASANYVAQYSLKKVGADRDGVVRPPPYARMSTRPAIGADWLERYRDDLAHGYLVADGSRRKIPRSYMLKLEQLDPQLAESVAYRAWEHRVRNPSDSALPERLRDAETIHQRRNELARTRAL